MPDNKKMICIHSHILPGVDDGAESFAETFLMLLRAEGDGVCGMFATPHSGKMSEHVKAYFERVSECAKDLFENMTVYSGCEVYCEGASMEHVLEALNSGRYPTLNSTKYVLMECSYWTDAENMTACVNALAAGGYVPVVAHMERYQYLRGNMELVDQLLKLGALMQVNVYHLSEEANETIRDWARRLVLQKKAHFLGTDCHRTNYKPPSARGGLAWIYDNVDRAYADALAFGNAARMLIGEKAAQCC